MSQNKTEPSAAEAIARDYAARYIDGGVGFASKECIGDLAITILEAARQISAASASPVVELAMCESQRLVLKPDTLYRFTIHDGCKACEAAADPASASPVGQDALAALTDEICGIVADDGRFRSDIARIISPILNELQDWRDLSAAVYALPLPEEHRRVKLWPNNWHQDAAMVAFHLKNSVEREALASASHAKTEGLGAEPDYGPGWFGHNTDGTQRNALAAKSTPPLQRWGKTDAEWAAEGYRILNEGELILDGDEFHRSSILGWAKATFGVGKYVGIGGGFRRPIDSSAPSEKDPELGGDA